MIPAEAPRRAKRAAEPGTAPKAVVAGAWVPGRAEPSHRAEMVTQWLCGEILERVEAGDRPSGWLRCRGGDGYEAWVAGGGLLGVTEAEARRWAKNATALSLGTSLVPGETEGAIEPPRHLPWGCRVELREDGALHLPGRVRARPADPDAIVSDRDRALRFPTHGEAVVSSGLRWLGAPYLWGGRTEWGVDCSGFVQAIFRLHGVELPRDSAPQASAAPKLEAEVDAEGAEWLEPADLLFFAPEGKGITHVAVWAGNGRIVHAAAANGCVALNAWGGSRPVERLLRDSLAIVTRPLARVTPGGATGGTFQP